jgi:RND family efflux transporter MFP subunit
MSTENAQPPPPHGESPAIAGQPPSKRRGPVNWLTISVSIVIILAVVVWRTKGSRGNSAALGDKPVTVAVVRVMRTNLCNEVTIPAEFRPYLEVELYAKVNGYVKEMKVDFGDRVEAGESLATIEVPELGDELRNAMAVEQQADADYTNANLIYNRLSSVNKEHPNLVAQQELDTAWSKNLTTTAAVAAAKAEAAKYRTLLDYTRITAPFRGVITRRYADPGALVHGGTSSESGSIPLLRLSDNYRLRLDIPVSLAYVKDIHVGDPVEVRLESLGGKTFSGKISRSTERVNEDTRTMIVEVEVPNPDLQIVPGSYVAATFKLQQRPEALSIPSAVVGGEENPTVYVVDGNSQIEPRKITLGLETPDRYEVTSGLKEGDLVVMGNHAFVRPGQKVDARLVTDISTP